MKFLVFYDNSIIILIKIVMDNHFYKTLKTYHSDILKTQFPPKIYAYLFVI
jgi:hypothetical protein